jgi:beta-ribofuranosylaminobenzene 5'-phosphate synthase
MIRIRTPSRLHFGLFSLPSEHAGPWLNQEGEPTIPRRQFGGVGLMIDHPGIDLTVAESKVWMAEGPLAERGLQFAKSYCKAAGIEEMFHIRVLSAASEHAGLGTGTQLGLAIAFAIGNCAESHVGASCSARAKILGRGQRSAIGIYGFDFGGLIIDGGKSVDGEIAPLVHRDDFPEEWGILLITPQELQGRHGRREIEAFKNLADQDADDRATDALCRLVLLGMLPAIAAGNMATFGEALYDFNRRVGMIFRPVQGGIYAHPRVEDIIKTLREMGVKGVGQSSWGPTIFAVAGMEMISELRNRLFDKKMIAPEEAIITRACNHGARVEFGA